MLLSVFIFVTGCGGPILMSAVWSGIVILVLRDIAAISASAADDMTIFIIVVRYRIEPLIILSFLFPN